MGNIYFEKDVNVYSMERGVFGHISKVCNKLIKKEKSLVVFI